jgi:CDP-glucose 4,6-dehydratase
MGGLADAYRGRRVLVTGHTGFKGSWLAAWLLELEAEVAGFALPPTQAESHFEQLGLRARIRHLEGDLRDGEAIARAVRETRPQIVFHLAAQALVREGYRDPKGTFDTNVAGAVNLLEAVRRADTVSTLVFVTSDKCYRNQDWEWGYRETDPLGGGDPYSASKACAEMVFDSYWTSLLAPSRRVRAATARAGNVIGGGDWAADRLVPDCIRALRKGEVIAIRNPLAVRPWQHVLESLGAYLLLGSRLQADQGETFCTSWNFGPADDGDHSVEEVAGDIVRHWGSGRMERAVDPAAPPEHASLRLNTDRARHRLGWRPVWDYGTCIRETVAWYKAHHDGASVPELTSGQLERYMAAWVEPASR